MKNYLHQRSKSLLAFAVGLTILSSYFAGEVEASECFYYGSDLANNATTTWDDETSTATLHADRKIVPLAIPITSAHNLIPKVNSYRWQAIIHIPLPVRQAMKNLRSTAISCP